MPEDQLAYAGSPGSERPEDGCQVSAGLVDSWQICLRMRPDWTRRHPEAPSRMDLRSRALSSRRKRKKHSND